MNDKDKAMGAVATAEYSPASRVLDEQAELPKHLMRLPGGEWRLWRCAGLRGAGFPVEGVLKLSAGDAAARADEVLDAEEAAEVALQEAISAARLELNSTALGERAIVNKALRRLKKGRVPEGLVVSSELETSISRFQVAVDAVDGSRQQYDEAFSQAQTDTSNAISDIARDERFREAVIWQNRRALQSGIDPLLRKSAESFHGSKYRASEDMIASYWQRYCVKNDTIGFFGPVGWANLEPEYESVIAKPGPSLLDSRNTYFEDWCIDAVAEKITQNRSILPWIAPRRKPIVYLEGTTLYLPFRGEISISPEQAAVLHACDGERTAKQIASDLIQNSSINLDSEAEVFSILEGMRTRGLILWELNVSIGVHPDRVLRTMIERIEDSSLRRQALDDLDDIVNARDAVACAAGDAEKLNQALGDLEATFTRLTGTASSRAAGKMYAGRTLVYEDCRRDIELKMGADVLNALGPPLSLLLTSARWFTYEVGRSYRETFGRMYDELASSGGSSTVDFVKFWQHVQAILLSNVTHPCETLLPSFQKRWAEVLSIDPAQRRVNYNSEALRPKVLSAFDAPAPGWRWARYHSPDLMIEAPSVEAIQRGDFTLIVGELHMAVNTLAGLLFFEQHPSQDDLIQASSCDVPPPRVVPLPPKSWPSTMARNQFAFISPEDFSLEFEGNSSGIVKLLTLPIGALVVENSDGALIVRTRDGQLRFDILEIFIHFLSMQSVNFFKILETKSHSPRIIFDRLVVSRETWRFPPDELGFVYEKDAGERFVAARRWAREHDFPRFVFARMPIEIKPFYLDFDSPIYVDTFAKFVRRTLESDLADPLVTVVEMLPGPNNAWLPDAEGQRYTSEIRIVAVDPAV